MSKHGFRTIKSGGIVRLFGEDYIAWPIFKDEAYYDGRLDRKRYLFQMYDNYGELPESEPFLHYTACWGTEQAAKSRDIDHVFSDPRIDADGSINWDFWQRIWKSEQEADVLFRPYSCCQRANEDQHKVYIEVPHSHIGAFYWQCNHCDFRTHPIFFYK